MKKHLPNQTREFRKKSAVVGEAKPTANHCPWGTKKNAAAQRQNTDENIIVQIPRTTQKNRRKVTFQNQAQEKNLLEKDRRSHKRKKKSD